MPELNVSTHVVVTLDLREFNLITRALGGRLKDEELVPAKELCDSLLSKRYFAASKRRKAGVTTGRVRHLHER